jgi:hypothetical protein
MRKPGFGQGLVGAIAPALISLVSFQESNCTTEPILDFGFWIRNSKSKKSDPFQTPSYTKATHKGALQLKLLARTILPKKPDYSNSLTKVF